MHKKQRWVLWKKYKDAGRLCRDGIWKAKAQLELVLARGVKKNKRGFYRYINRKRNIQKGELFHISSTGWLVTMEKKNVEVIKNFFFCHSLHTALKWMSWKVGTEEAISLPL